MPYIKTVIADLPPYEKSDIDQLTTRMPMLRAMLQTPPTKRFATAFIVHCHCGCDRTGEVSGAYAMEHLGYSARQALVWDDSVPNRAIESFSFNGMMWYCYYLQYVKNVTSVDCANV